MDSITNDEKERNTEGEKGDQRIAEGAGGDEREAAASIREQNTTDKGNDLFRVSIKFKVGHGWRGSINRDFPGRCFSHLHRSILLAWAEEFRQGKSAQIEPKDERFVKLPQNQKGAIRRRPFRGNATVWRKDAFHWLRATHNRLLTTMELKNPSLLNGSITSKSTIRWQKISTKISAFLPAKVQMKSRASEPEVIIEVVWDDLEIDQLKDHGIDTQRRNRFPFRVLLDVGGKEVKVNLPSETGRGAFFILDGITPGKYTVNGAPLEILMPDNSNLGKRRRHRAVSKKHQTPSGSPSQKSPPDEKRAPPLPDAKRGASSRPIGNNKSNGSGNANDISKRSKTRGKAELFKKRGMLKALLQTRSSLDVKGPNRTYIQGIVDIQDDVIQHIANPLELTFLKLMKAQMADILRQEPICWWPEVVGDVSLLRYLRESSGIIQKAVGLFLEHLEIRDKYSMNEIRMKVFSSIGKSQRPIFNSRAKILEDFYGGVDISKLTTYSQGDIAYGDQVSKYVRVNFNLCRSDENNPVELSAGYLNMDRTVKEIGFDSYAKYIIECDVRRAIQLDILSREQLRIVKVDKIIAEASATSLWKMFIPGKMSNLMRTHAEIVHTLPLQVNCIHWIPPSWAAGMFCATLLPWFPPSLRKHFCVHSYNYDSKLKLSVGDNALKAVKRLQHDRCQSVHGNGIRPEVTHHQLPGSHELMTKQDIIKNVSFGLEISMTPAHRKRSGTLTIRNGKPFEVCIAVDTSSTNLQLSWEFSLQHECDAVLYETFLLGTGNSQNEDIYTSESDIKMFASQENNDKIIMTKIGTWSIGQNSKGLSDFMVGNDPDHGEVDVGFGRSTLTHENNCDTNFSSGGFVDLPIGQGVVLFRMHLQVDKADQEGAEVNFHFMTAESSVECNTDFLSRAVTSDNYDREDIISTSTSVGMGTTKMKISSQKDQESLQAFQQNGFLMTNLKESISEAVSNGRLSTRLVRGHNNTFPFAKQRGGKRRTKQENAQPQIRKDYEVSAFASCHEVELIDKMRYYLATHLTIGRHAKYTEVVGNISLLRYIRDCGNDVEAAVIKFKKALDFRRKFGLDDLRDRIKLELDIRGGIDSEDGFNFIANFSVEELPLDSDLMKYARKLPMVLNAGFTADHHPIMLCSGGVGTMSEICEATSSTNVNKLLASLFVMRQLQLDILSRTHGILLKTVVINPRFEAGGWKFLFPGLHTQAASFWSELSSCHPEIYKDVHIIMESWYLQTCIKAFLYLFPKKVQDLVSLYTVDSYMQTLVPKISSPSLPKILKLISNDGMTSTVQSSSCTSALWKPGDLIDNHLLKGGKYSSHEIGIRVNPCDRNAIQGVQWSFRALSEDAHQSVNFVVLGIEDSEDRNEKELNLNSGHKFTLLPEQNVKSHAGGIMWPNKRKEGLIVLKWTYKSAGDYSNNADVNIVFEISGAQSFIGFTPHLNSLAGQQKELDNEYAKEHEQGEEQSYHEEHGIEDEHGKLEVEIDNSFVAQHLSSVSKMSQTSAAKVSKVHVPAKEEYALKQLRKVLAGDISEAACSEFPEVVGDLALLRILKNKKYDVGEACAEFRSQLAIRNEYNLDVVRHRIMNVTPRKKLMNFVQDDVCHSNEIKKFLHVHYNLAWDPKGRIVVLFSVVGPLIRCLVDDDSLFYKFQEYIRETVIRRQIQLHLLSQKFGRLIGLNIVVNNHVGGSGWKLSIPGNPRDLGKMWMRLMKGTPGICEEFHWLKANWALRGIARVFQMTSMQSRLSIYGFGDLLDHKNLRTSIGEDAVSCSFSFSYLHGKLHLLCNVLPYSLFFTFFTVIL